MYKIMHQNEGVVKNMFFSIIPELIDVTNRDISIESCQMLPDGLYLLYDVPITYDLAHSSNFTNEFDPRIKLNEILRFARVRFGGNHYETEIRRLAFNQRIIYSTRSVDFAIVKVIDNKVANLYTFEVASEDHFSGKYCLNKTISDALKYYSSRLNTVILDARTSVMYHIPDIIKSLNIS